MKYIHTLVFLMTFTIVVVGQNRSNERQQRQEKMESRIESQKVAFITQKLELSPEEAQQFWPVYNEFQAELKKIRTTYKEDLNTENDIEANADSFLENLFSKEQEELDIKKEYFNRLKTTIPTEKVAKLYIIEKKFREEILERIRSQIGKNKRKARRNRGN